MLLPVQPGELKDIERGGVWVAVGGVRGITPHVALALGQRFGLKMHLLGRTPRRDIAPAWRGLDGDGKKRLKAELARESLAGGETLAERWQQVEEQWEIDGTLCTFAAAGVPATYHACDASDWNQLSETLAEIRRSEGPIHGILQGAGVRVPEKSPGQTCQSWESLIRVTLDATVALACLTRQDPLKYFVALGSIPGAFGAEEDADGALGSDMICKLVGWLRHERPETHAVGFHWRPWGEVGPTLQPGGSTGARAASVPPAEAACHVIEELRAGTPESEVVVTSSSCGEVCCDNRESPVAKRDASPIDFIREKAGRLDILVSNAATGGFRPLLSARVQHFQAAFNSNVLATILLVQSAAPLLQQGPHRGKVVVLSSHGADLALPMYGLIGGSKAALESIARHLTLELGDRGVNINIVKAGLVETDSTRRIPGAEQMFSGRKHKTMTGDRMLEPADVADAVLFLCSNLSDMIQGQTLTVDGGMAVHG